MRGPISPPGHSSAVETLDTYAHLWPDSDYPPREAVDSVLGAPADHLRPADLVAAIEGDEG